MIEVTLAAKPYPIRDTRFNHPDIATTAGLDPTTVAYCVKAFNDITTVLRDRGVRLMYEGPVRLNAVYKTGTQR